MEIRRLEKEVERLQFREKDGIDETEQLRFELEDILKRQIYIDKNGLNILKIQEQLSDAKKDILLLQDNLAHKEFEYKKLVEATNKEKRNLLGKIKELKNISKPLKYELRVKDELIKRYGEAFKLNMKELKMFKCILKVPTLC